MLIIRPVTRADVKQLLEHSVDVGVGMTTMPVDLETWCRRIDHSVASFRRTRVVSGTEETYFMVMEDSDSRKLHGTSAIYSGVGNRDPFYSYKLSTLVQSSEQLGISVSHKVLFLVNDYTGAAELGSLYLTPEMRRDGNGRFLSRCRYLLLADFPERFGDTVIAEMRGWQDEKSHSPFWRHLGKKFFGIAYADAEYHSAVRGSQIINDLMPRYPIYVDLLPAQAREVIGRPHDATRPALKLLEQEGFRFEGYVDVFDGGPTVRCDRERIKSVRESRGARLGGAGIPSNAMEYLISNSRLKAYRVVRSELELDAAGRVWLPEEAIECLQLVPGDPLRYLEA